MDCVQYDSDPTHLACLHLSVFLSNGQLQNNATCDPNATTAAQQCNERALCLGDGTTNNCYPICGDPYGLFTCASGQTCNMFTDITHLGYCGTNTTGNGNIATRAVSAP